MNFRSIIILVIILCFVSCKKDCETTIERCNENLSNDFGYCTEAYKRWFYDNNLNRCVETKYVGYSARGFANKQECEICLCNK
jgi:hypothetical protein